MIKKIIFLALMRLSNKKLKICTNGGLLAKMVNHLQGINIFVFLEMVSINKLFKKGTLTCNVAASTRLQFNIIVV